MGGYLYNRAAARADSGSDSDFFMAQFIAVFRGGTAGVFAETAVEGGQIVETAAKSNIRNRAVPVFRKQGLHCLNSFITQIVVECGVCVLFEQAGEVILGKTDVFRCLFQR